MRVYTGVAQVGKLRAQFLCGAIILPDSLPNWLDAYFFIVTTAVCNICIILQTCIQWLCGKDLSQLDPHLEFFYTFIPLAKLRLGRESPGKELCDTGAMYL